MAFSKIENSIRSLAESLVQFISKYRATLSVSLIIVAVLVLIVGRKTELVSFPFDAKVWGNAADWVMVTVTLVTAIYLVKTFLEQKRFNEEQAGLNEIQRKQRLKSIRPYFVISEEIEITSSGRQYTYLKINLNGSNAYNVIISNMKKPSLPNVEFEFIAQNVGIDTKFFMTSGGKNFKKGYVTDDFELGAINGDITLNLLLINFEDEDGNTYSQRLAYKDSNLIFSPPMMEQQPTKLDGKSHGY